jgi:hypothetical protein
MEHQGDQLIAGPCFRTIAFNGCAMAHCPGRVEWHGRHQDGTGRWFDVDACTKHAVDLLDRRRIGVS